MFLTKRVDAAAVRLIAVLGTAIAIAVGATGCGGDDDSAANPAGQQPGGTVTTSSLSKSQFIDQASAACLRSERNAAAKAAAYMRRHSSEKLPEGVLLANMVKAIVLPTIEAESAVMRKLGAPAGDEADIEAILAIQREAIDRMRQQRQVKSVDAINSYFTTYNERLREYGFKAACIYG